MYFLAPSRLDRLFGRKPRCANGCIIVEWLVDPSRVERPYRCGVCHGPATNGPLL